MAVTFMCSSQYRHMQMAGTGPQRAPTPAKPSRRFRHVTVFAMPVQLKKAIKKLSLGASQTYPGRRPVV